MIIALGTANMIEDNVFALKAIPESCVVMNGFL